MAKPKPSRAIEHGARAAKRGGLLLLAAALMPTFIAAAQPTTTPVDRTVEMVLAGSQRQAQVVARAMRTGFLVDQLLIPDTSYLGRVPWSELTPAIRQALEPMGAGEPRVFTVERGKHLVAQILPDGPPAILGATAYAEHVSTPNLGDSEGSDRRPPDGFATEMLLSVPRLPWTTRRSETYWPPWNEKGSATKSSAAWL